ncbi:MAG: alpha/beta hydrolase-fold protein [Anaerolineales bacterium]
MMDAKPFLFTLLILLMACSPAPAVTRLPGATPASAPPASPAASPLPAATLPPTGCQQTHGQLDSGVIETSLLDKPMRYQVYLPPCYADSAESYPALYLLHGQGFDENQWLRLGLAEQMDALLAAGEIPPFVVILPFDYSYKQPAQYHFEQVFIEILMPRLQSEYRLRPGRESSAIGGLSRGGAWAFYLGSRHPDLFAFIGAHSPALFSSDMGAFPLRLRDLPEGQKPSFYIDAGNNDPDLALIQQIIALIDAQGLEYEWHPNLGFHDEKYWRAHLPEYLRWYGANFRQKNSATGWLRYKSKT